MSRVSFKLAFAATAALLAARPALPADEAIDTLLERYDVVWRTPSADSSGSMPIGNGDVGLNVWVEPSGDLVLLLSKTDAWSENHRLLKLGRLRVKLDPPLSTAEPFFEQRLRLQDGEITIRGGRDDDTVHMRVWVDAHAPVVIIEGQGPSARRVQVALEVWRTAPRALQGDEAHSAYGLHGGPKPIVCEPDTVLSDQPDRIVWYHRNKRSIWADNLRYQGLDAFLAKGADPLLGRTFGAVIEGKELVSRSATLLETPAPVKQFAVRVHPHCAQTRSVEQWLGQVHGQAKNHQRTGLEPARRAHRNWWDAFWNRSWLFVSGAPEAEAITRGYVLQRWINACGGRGRHPIKFNGSIFTVDMAGHDPDYRRWGGPYWWQNTRLPYWPMLSCGDFDLMRPLFQMYQATIPLAEHRTRVWYQHEGAFVAETMYFWGGYTNANYGWKRGDLPIGVLANRFIRREYTASLELLAMMLDYYQYTEDEKFLAAMLLPMSDSLLRFWDEHYQRDQDGKLHMYPAQALETLQDARNPTPDVAGLQWVLRRLRKLPQSKAGAERHSFWQSLAEAVPALPMAGASGQKHVLGAAEVFGGRGNSENPELYTVFPFRLFGVGKPELEVGRLTFHRRPVKGSTGWRQDDTQAALLGLSDVAAHYVAVRARSRHRGSRFPAFWGPNFDWVPDQDHGGNLMRALQAMALQSDDGKILVLPAWPENWNVRFRLHAPRRTTVECVYRGGKIERLTVTPAARSGDVESLSYELSPAID